MKRVLIVCAAVALVVSTSGCARYIPHSASAGDIDRMAEQVNEMLDPLRDSGVLRTSDPYPMVDSSSFLTDGGFGGHWVIGTEVVIPDEDISWGDAVRGAEADLARAEEEAEIAEAAAQAAEADVLARLAADYANTPDDMLPDFVYPVDGWDGEPASFGLIACLGNPEILFADAPEYVLDYCAIERRNYAAYQRFEEAAWAVEAAHRDRLSALDTGDSCHYNVYRGEPLEIWCLLEVRGSPWGYLGLVPANAERDGSGA